MMLTLHSYCKTLQKNGTEGITSPSSLNKMLTVTVIYICLFIHTHTYSYNKLQSKTTGLKGMVCIDVC